MGTTVDKFEAAFETKDLIKSGINRLGGSLTSESTFRSYATELENLYDDMPKVSGEGSNLSLTPTRKGGLSIIPKGACEQDSYSGKNKLNASAESYTLPASTNKYQVVGNVDLVENTKYYISYNIDNASTSNLRSTPYIRIGTGTRMYQNTSENYNITTGRKVWEFTPLETATYDFGYWINNSDVAVTISDFMISTSNDTTYEKYVGGIPSPNPDYPQDIRVVTGDNEVVVSPKNIITDNTPYSNTLTDTRSYVVLEIYLGITGTVQKKRIVSTNIYSTGIYHLTFIPDDDYSRLRIKHSGATRDFSKDYSNLIIQKGIEYTVSLDFTGVNPTVEGGYSFKDVQLEYGDTATTYVEGKPQQTYTLHLGTNYLAGIGDYKDEIVGKTDAWKVVRKITKVMVDNNTNIIHGGTNVSGLVRLSIKKDGLLPYSAGTIGNVFCTHYTKESANSTYLNKLGIAIGTSSTATTDNIFIYDENYNTTDRIEAFRTWAMQNNLTIYAILQTLTEETITDTTLITDLNNMYQAMGYDGTTNITITSDSNNAQMIASVSALKGE